VLRYIATVALVLMVIGGSAYATTVMPGGTVTPDIFTATNDVTKLASNTGTWTTPSSGGVGGATGTFTDAVYATSIPGLLDFVYQFSNSSTSHNSITSTSAFSFAGFSADVGYMTNGSLLPGGIFVDGTPFPAVPPILISEDMGGSTITYNLNVITTQNIAPGSTSPVLVVQVMAKEYEPGMVGLIAGGTTNLPGFQPVIPEPSFFLPVGAGLLAAIAFGRRKFAQRT
jgi:hypothetical protein